MNNRPKKDTRDCAGFTLIELLVVIAIIAVLIALLVPAVQIAREATAKAEAELNLEKIASSTTAFHNRMGDLPNDLKELAEFCIANPGDCPADSQLLAMGHDGTTYYVGSANGGIWKTIAEPLCPGRTGMETLEIEMTVVGSDPTITSRRSFPTPGAVEERQKMFANVRAAGGHAMLEFFKLHLATRDIRSFTSSPANFAEVLSIVDVNGDETISLQEALYDWPGEYAARFDGIDPAIEPHVREFLSKVQQEMKVDSLSAETRSQIHTGPGVFKSTNGGSTFTPPGLCEMTQTLVTDARVAEQLCTKLKRVESAEQRNDLRAKASALAQYLAEVVEQTDKTLTNRNAMTLIAIAERL